MTGHDRHEIERRLRGLRAPDEEGAEDRGLRVIQRAISNGAPRRVPRFRPLRVTAVAIAALAVTIGLTPAGASVREWIDDAVTSVEDDRPGLTRLPAAGRVLTTSASGAWIVDQDGSRRRLGAYREASWSPQGIHVVAATGRQLVALDTQGEVQWAIPRPARVSALRWAPSGIRIAYRSGRDLRLVEGDSDDDQLLVRRAAPVAPEWRPPPAGAPAASNVLAYVDRAGRVVVLDTESRAVSFSTRPGFNAVDLAWLAHDRLVVAGAERIVVLGANGRTVATIRQPRGTVVTGIATSPTQARIAVVRRREGSSLAPGEAEPTGLGQQAELASIRLGSGAPRSGTLFTGPGEFSGATFSPDGRWLLAGWKDADQWLFLRPAPKRKLRDTQRKLLDNVVAIPDIARQLDPGGKGPAAFPRIQGWCCGPETP